MDYREQQNSIKTYIETYYPQYLTQAEKPQIEAYIDDFLDLDKYSKSRQLFYFFDYYNYEYLSNQSESEEFEFKVYIVFKNDRVQNLRDNLLDYTSIFYTMFDQSGRNLGGIADYGQITSVEFFPAAEGHREVKIAEITIKLFTETE